MDIETPTRLAEIRRLNDAFRTSFRGGEVLLTQSVSDLPPMVGGPRKEVDFLFLVLLEDIFRRGLVRRSVHFILRCQTFPGASDGDAVFARVASLPFMSEHEGPDPFGHCRVSGIRRCLFQLQIVIRDMKDELAIAQVEAQIVMLAVRVVVFVEVREGRDLSLFDGKSPFDTDERSEGLDAKEFRPDVVKDAIAYPAAEINPDDVPF
jgi:hypothetical protein